MPTPVKHNKAKCNKPKYACSNFRKPGWKGKKEENQDEIEILFFLLKFSLSISAEFNLMHFRIVMSNIMKAKTVITDSSEFDFGKT